MSRSICFFALLAFFLGTTAARSAEPELRAGAAAVDVSPTQYPVLVNGGMLTRSANKLSDPIYARALVFDDGTTQVAICVVDSCLMPRDLLDAAKAEASKATGIPAANMLVSATHTHTAPSVMGVLGTDADPNYPPVLRAGIAKAIAAAHKNLEPAATAWGVANAADYVGVRRWVRRSDRMIKDPFGEQTVHANMHPGYLSGDAIGPSGPEDPDLTVLSVRAIDGRPIALLGNIGMHYFSGPAPVSADYFGVFCSKVMEELKASPAVVGKPPFVGILSQGTSGDLWRVDYSQPKPAKAITMGEYAGGLAKLAVQANADKPHTRGSIAMAAADIRIKGRVPSPQRLEWAKKIVAEMGDRPPKNNSEVYAREAIELHNRPEADMLLQAIRIGDFGLTAMPNEVYALTGLKIKAQSPLAGTMNIELANDELGYIPPPEQHPLGGYTTWPARSSYPAADSEPKMVETVLSLLEKVAGKPRTPMEKTPGMMTVGAYGEAVLKADPVAYWRMNEMSAVPAVATNGLTSMYEPGVLFWLDGLASDAFSGKGIVNRSPHFAGGRMKADLKSELGIDYSVSFWFWNGMATEARPVTGYLFSRGPADDKAAPGDHLGIGGTHENGKAQGKIFLFTGDKGQMLVGKTPLALKAWHHVVLTRQSDGAKVRVYVNGELEIDGAAEATSNASTLFFGGRADNFSNLEGKLDEVAVFGKALSAEQAKAQFAAAGITAPPPATMPAATQPAPKQAAAALATQPSKVSGMRLSQPLSAAESAKLHVVKAGYEIELVAAEPMVLDPIAFNWGPDGKLWVVEMADYPYGADGKMKASGRVRFLQDSDNDGTYDKSVVFAENLNFPTGILPWRDGVIVTAAPDVLFLQDANNDGIADAKKVLFTGFTEGNPQLRVNAPNYGLDGWVYLANGVASKGTVKSIQTGKGIEVSGRDIRIKPDTGEIETETGVSQFGRRMDNAGDWFGVHNSYPGRHFVIPERYSRRNPHATLPQGYYDLGFSANPKVFPLSQGQKRYGTAFFAQSGRFTSACGLAIDRDNVLFPGDWAGANRHLFTCEPVHNLVQHNVLTPTGATYTAKRADDEMEGEFLASRDEWFRPVFLASGPDGALYVADMYRFMIEHPDWLPAEGKEDYRPFYRLGENLGRIWRIKPKGTTLRATPKLNELATPELVKALDSTNGWQRDQVQAMLIWRNDAAAVPLLRKTVMSGNNPFARLHALATLGALSSLDDGVLEKALTDAHPAVRREALRLAETSESNAVRAAAIHLAVVDPDAKVRQQLAFSLGAWDTPYAANALAGLAKAAGDDIYQTAAVMTAAGTHYQSLATELLKEADPTPTALMRDLQAMALAKGDRDTLAKLLLPVLATRNGRYTMEQLQAFGRFLDLLAQQKSSLAKLAKPKDALTDLIGSTPDVFAAARVVAGAVELPVEKRLIGISLLGRDTTSATADMQQLSAIYAPGASPAIQSAVARSLGRLTDVQVPAILITRWSDRPAEVKSAVVDVLLTREPWAMALLEKVKSGEVAVLEIDAARRQRLLKHSSARVREQASAAFGESAGGRTKVVEAYRPAIDLPGDAIRGQKVFAQNCATCHKSGNEGIDIGPNLISVAGWPADAMLTAVFDPSRSAEPRFLAYTCTLDSGEAVYGILLRETPAGVTMKGLDGVERNIPRQQIKSLECMNKSLMPDGMEAAIDVQQMADLLAFVKSQKP